LVYRGRRSSWHWRASASRGWIAQIQDPRTSGRRSCNSLCRLAWDDQIPKCSFVAAKVTSSWGSPSTAGIHSVASRHEKRQSGAQLPPGLAAGSALSALSALLPSPIPYPRAPGSDSAVCLSAQLPAISATQERQHGDFRSISACSLQRR
jgi:hypothetical protein